MTHLVTQWRERVNEVQNELKTIKEETAAIQRQREHLQIERNTFAVSSKEEKNRSQAEMRDLEAQSAATAEIVAQAAARKAEADRIINSASTEYSLDLVQLMNEVKHAEAALSGREIPAEALERESDMWCTEEEGLRERMRGVEKAIVEQRRAASAALASAEEEARNAEAELHAARMERNADEGQGLFVFSDNVVAQYPELLEYSTEQQSGGERIRKGRSASGKPLSRQGSRKGSVALQQRRQNEIVEEDAAPTTC